MARNLLPLPHMRTSNSLVIIAALTALVPATSLSAKTIEISDGETDSRIEVKSVALRSDGVVSGQLVNRTAEEIRDIRLLVDVIFHWTDEFHPGEDSPGRSVVLTVAGPLPPNGTLAFDLRPNPAIPARDDGRFEAKAHVMGYEFVASAEPAR